MAFSDVEPFPPLHDFSTHSTPQSHSQTQTRRRKSSTLKGELPGDTDVAALATLHNTTPASQSPPTSEKSVRRSKRRTAKRLFSRWKRACFRHTWLLPLVLMTVIASLYLVYPYPSNPIAACLFLSYPVPPEPGSEAPIQYAKGGRDFAFVGFYTIVLSFTREFIMQRIIRPIAISYGIKSRAKQARFMEQFYTAIYFGVFGPFGIWVMSRTPVWYFNTTGMYESCPHKTHEAVFKAYYLLQASYWFQQMIVLLLMLEKPRKDFKELVAHHFITLALIWCSYRFHFTYMGLAVYITMDVSDFFLATSKVLNYIDSPIVAPYFFCFMCIWAYLRHYINLKILWSIITEYPYVGPFELNWETQQYKCWIAQYITFALLAALQAVNLFWWFYICRIAYRIVVLDIQEDERSEYEDSGDEAAENDQGQAINTTSGASYAKAASESRANGTPKLLVNGQEPDLVSEKEQNGSIGARLRERKCRK
ncbi:longevity assurance proteins LAG1/LAC1 [Sporormia fimetaria CBS 119925]|uniref:Longevity assurance proteins LAG1/LAC1 n=1 Tax=Sporormia fimetaria CBS 119925 TaxID=1340428 RepID=A0A6A6V7X9_9PLEO|nr:longevity assurance proteins LAG1/LAC1 [Sporormia fimetaria CBS 119925]